MDITRLPWGKYDKGLTHRLEHHCADVAACFEALVEEPLLRRRFDEAAGGGGLHDVTLSRLTVLAFLHDFGKVSAGFQFKVGGRRRGVPRHQGHLKPFFWACQRPEVFARVGLNQLLAWGDGLHQLLRGALAHHGRPIAGPSIEHEGPPEIWRPVQGYDYDPITAGRELFRRAQAWFREAFGQGPELPGNPALAHLFAVEGQAGRRSVFRPAYESRRIAATSAGQRGPEPNVPGGGDAGHRPGDTRLPASRGGHRVGRGVACELE